MPLKLGASAEAMVGIDEHGLVAYWNDAASRLLGLEKHQAIGKPCHDVLRGLKPSGGHLCSPNCAVREACKNSHAPRRFEMIVQHADGAELWVEVTTVVVYDDDRPVALHLLSESVAAKQLTTLAESVVRRMSAAPAPAADFSLTRRENDVLALLAEGLRTPDIAERLQLAETTVRSHIQNLLPKLGVHSQAEAVVLALRSGLVHLQ